MSNPEKTDAEIDEEIRKENLEKFQKASQQVQEGLLKMVDLWDDIGDTNRSILETEFPEGITQDLNEVAHQWIDFNHAVKEMK